MGGVPAGLAYFATVHQLSVAQPVSTTGFFECILTSAQPSFQPKLNGELSAICHNVKFHAGGKLC